MTNEEAKDIMQKEKDCLIRCDLDKCEGDCLNCKLLTDTNRLLEAYEMAIKALEFMAECEERCKESFTRRYAVMLEPSNGK